MERKFVSLEHGPAPYQSATGKAPFHVTAIGVPACTALKEKRVNANISLLSMFKNILPEGPI